MDSFIADGFLDGLFSGRKVESLPPVYSKGFTQCVFCKQPFTNENVYSQMGWRETQISGSCEKCFDDICQEYQD